MALDQNFIRRLIEEQLAMRRERVYVWLLAMLSIVFLGTVFYFLYLKAPAKFPVRIVTTVEANAGLNQIAQKLFEQKVIKSPFWFRIAVIMRAGQRGVLAGDYLFEKPANVFSVASRMTSGNFGLTSIRLTFPEGITTSQMSVLLSAELIDFNTEDFLKLAKPL